MGRVTADEGEREEARGGGRSSGTMCGGRGGGVAECEW